MPARAVTPPPTTPRADKSRFWQFSLALYARERVPETCLRLQDQHGVDVNVLLYCLFRASEGHRLTGAGIAAMDRQVSPWRAEVVRPLRAIRRVMKETPLLVDAGTQARLRDRIKACELEAEQAQQLELERIGSGLDVTSTEPRHAAVANYRAYAEALGISLPLDALATLAGDDAT